MRELDKARITEQLLQAYEDATPSDIYKLAGRSYRVREITVTVAEFETTAGWVPPSGRLRDQLLCKISEGGSREQ